MTALPRAVIVLPVGRLDSPRDFTMTPLNR